MNQCIVYHSVNKIWFAVAKVDIGGIKQGKAIIGIQGYDKKQVEMQLSDWCSNEEIDPKKVKLETGFVPGEVTNHKVYAQSWLN